MLRIHFEPEDLSRTTVAPSGDILWEILLSLHALQERTEEFPFNTWSRRARPLIPASLHALFEVAPPRGYSADFLTPTRGECDLDAAVEEVLATPPHRYEADLTELATQRRTPFVRQSAWARRSAALRRLAGDIRTYEAMAIAPCWRQISRDIESDRLRRTRTLAAHGVERLLKTLHPYARWRHPVLEVDEYVDQDLRLEGRGLVLVPSFFCRLHPITLKAGELPPALVFPVARRTWLGGEHDDDALAGLLGRTRVTVLENAIDGCSTTELSRIAGISAASVSHHTKVLREAGLITTQRDGNAVCHQITELGLNLLES